MDSAALTEGEPVGRVVREAVGVMEVEAVEEGVGVCLRVGGGEMEEEGVRGEEAEGRGEGEGSSVPAELRESAGERDVESEGREEREGRGEEEGWRCVAVEMAVSAGVAVAARGVEVKKGLCVREAAEGVRVARSSGVAVGARGVAVPCSSAEALALALSSR